QGERGQRSQERGRRADRPGSRQPRRRRRVGNGEGTAVIAQMDQVTVVGRRKLVKDVLTALQNLGVVQVEPLEPTESDGTIKRLKLAGEDLATRETWDRILARATSLADVLGI